MPIDTTYKQHDIHATAFEIATLWEAHFTVSYEEDSYAMMKVPLSGEIL